jgi:hypothetical protein
MLNPFFLFLLRSSEIALWRDGSNMRRLWEGIHHDSCVQAPSEDLREGGFVQQSGLSERVLGCGDRTASFIEVDPILA